MMNRWWQRIIALSDSQLTADFQKICGIRSLEDHEQNQTFSSTSNGHLSHASELVTDSGCCECECECNCQCASYNTNTFNGDTHQLRNGNRPYQNGLTPSSDLSLKKRHGQKNGFIVTNGDAGHFQFHNSQNSHSDNQILENGTKERTACNCSKHTDIVGNPKTSSFSRTSNNRSDVHLPKYTVENKLLYYIFLFGASLGNEIFYIVYFSIGLWQFDSYIFRRVSVVWCVIMYVGQAAKDLICWPRPTSPPTTRLEERYELEYGMPSTHAMVGVVIPFGAVYFSYGYYEYNLFLGLLVATIWCCLVSFSRLYLGMHSVLDILAGIVSALFIMIVCIPFVDMIDCLIMAHPWGFPGLNLLMIGLCLAYPELKEWSTARGDTTQVLAVFSGIYQGQWYTAQVTTPEMAEAAAMTALTGWAAIAAAIVRQVVGMLLMVAMLNGIKKLVVYVMATLFGMDPKDPRCKQYLPIEVTYKYIGYFTPCFCAAYVMPIIYQYCGLHRADYLREVLHHSHHFGL